MPETATSTASRIYFVAQKGADTNEAGPISPRLVRATHPAPALRHVAQDLFDVRVATQDDLVAALAKNVQVEHVQE